MRAGGKGGLAGIALVTLTLWPRAASARRTPLEPQNRVHMGVSMADSQALGATAGFESRLTRLIYVDVGGFASQRDPLGPHTTGDASMSLRDAIFVTPGLRMPHRYGKGVNWDLTVRGGFGAVWSVAASTDDPLQSNPSLVLGADLLLHKGRVGVRPSAKAFYFKPYDFTSFKELRLVQPEFALEASYQW